jgi:hypothetical protein
MYPHHHVSKRTSCKIKTTVPGTVSISKGGRRKAIHPLPRYRDGVFAGFVELAIPIGDHLPRFDRD